MNGPRIFGFVAKGLATLPAAACLALVIVAPLCLGACGGASTGTQVLASPPPETPEPPAPPAPPTEFDVALNGPAGGPHEGGEEPISIPNPDATETPYIVTSNQTWMQWSISSTGTIQPEEALELSVTVDAQTAPTDFGAHSATITIANELTETPFGLIHVTLRIDGAMTASGLQGGPFESEGGPFIIRNDGAEDAAYRIVADRGWVTWTAPDTGAIPATGALDLGISLAAAADALIPGPHVAKVTVEDPDTGESRAVIQVSLQVVPTTVGWTEFEASTDTKKVHVSSSGNDTTGDGSIQKPYATIARGYKDLRNGYPDWLLLKRGDTWTNEAFTGTYTSGRSADEPQLIGAYGAGSVRPKIKQSQTEIYSTGSKEKVSHVAIVGLHFECTASTDIPSGFRMLGQLTNFLLEDMLIEKFATNIVLSPDKTEWPNGNDTVKIRRCVIVDARNGTGHAQGLFAAATHKLLVEECVFDHNGWVSGSDVYNATKFNHNMYLSVKQDSHVIRNNIVARGSAAGIFARSGGVVNGNLCLNNPGNIQFGYSLVAPQNTGGNTESGEIIGNVISMSNDDDEDRSGVGILVANSDGVDVAYNICAHHAGAVDTQCIVLASSSEQGPIDNVDVYYNIVYDWARCIRLNNANFDSVTIRSNDFQVYDSDAYVWFDRDQMTDGNVTASGNLFYGAKSATSRYYILEGLGFSDWASEYSDTTSTETKVSYSDADLTIDDYRDSGTLEDFLAEARKQSRATWREQYTAQAVVAWFQDNFDLELPE